MNNIVFIVALIAIVGVVIISETQQVVKYDAGYAAGKESCRPPINTDLLERKETTWL